MVDKLHHIGYVEFSEKSCLVCGNRFFIYSQFLGNLLVFLSARQQL